jgi:hypothetical protein
MNVTTDFRVTEYKDHYNNVAFRVERKHQGGFWYTALDGFATEEGAEEAMVRIISSIQRLKLCDPSYYDFNIYFPG